MLFGTFASHIYHIDHQIVESWLDTFEKQGWVEWQNFLSMEHAMAIRKEIEQVQMKNGFRQAGIGKSNQQHVDTGQRGDFISWIDRMESLPFTHKFIEQVEGIISELNRNFYLGIQDFECHYAHYPPGSFYKKHVDRHSSGSSRRVSMVLYLNPDWKEDDGGELRIYRNDGDFDSIRPQLGTLALFLSELEHEVIITSRDRMSITGWLLNEKIL